MFFSTSMLPVSVVAQSPDTTTRSFYYSLILPGGKAYSPLPAAEFISCSHRITHIAEFLFLFNRTIKDLCLTPQKPVIAKVEVDFSKAMIQSVLLGFNGLNVIYYLQ